MRALLASDQDYPAIAMLQTAICVLTNANMHPWDVQLTRKERRRTLKRLLRAQALMLECDCWLEFIDGLP